MDRTKAQARITKSANAGLAFAHVGTQREGKASPNPATLQRGRKGRRGTFATWTKTEAPHQLNLEPGNVAWICRVMSDGEEMHGVTTWTALANNLKLRRTSLRFPSALAWERLMLTARCLWRGYQGGAK